MMAEKSDRSRRTILISATMKKAVRHRFKMQPVWRDGKPTCPRCTVNMTESDGILATVCTFTCSYCGHVC